MQPVAGLDGDQRDRLRPGQGGRPGPATEGFERFLAGALPEVVEEALAAEGDRLHRAVLGRVERVLLGHVLARSGGNQLRAARLLGINRNTLRKRLRRLGLLPPTSAADGG
jgi:two-component system nitrogen regulation response regulator GlnG